MTPLCKRSSRRFAFALIGLLLCTTATAFIQSPTLLFGQRKEEFAARRAALKAAAGGALVLLKGPTEQGDIERGRFRTDNNVFYLSGLEASGTLVAILPDGDPSGKSNMVFLPNRSPGANAWTDPVPGPGSETETSSGVDAALDLRTVWTALKPSIEAAKVIYLQGRVGTVAKHTENARLEEAIRAINPNVEIKGGAERMVNAQRWKKSAGEIASLKQACIATGFGHANAAKAIKPGVSELEVEGVILAGFRKGGAVREGFPSIVGTGPNATVLHHFASERLMKAGDLVVVDIGAEYNYYTADITRTFPANGKFSTRQKQVYQLVLDTQRECEKFVKPGVTTLRELDQYARSVMRKSPLRAKDRSGADVSMDRFFAHGLGHWVGLDVHDVQGDSNVLAPGTVFTIEPGIYLPDENIGVRIEDTYLVTETGLEKLSGHIPSDIAGVEAAMKGLAAKGAAKSK